MNRKLVIGLDLGGTNIKGALLDRNGNILFKKEVATLAQEGPEAVALRMAGLVSEFEAAAKTDGEEVIGVGIGIPGLPDQENGDVIFAPNLGWRNVPLVKLLKKTVTVPVLLENDANVAALGEQWRGAGRGSQNMIMITIGTGIGGGLIINGGLYSGTNGNAGEIGHTVIDPAGPLCTCGRQGCLETLTSAMAMKRMAEEAVARGEKTSLAEQKEIEARDVICAAREKDPIADKIVNSVAHYLGIGIANMINLFNPDTVVIGGGVSRAGDILLNPLRDSTRKWSLDASCRVVKLALAELGNDAGCIGAGRLVLNRLGHQH